MENKLSEDLPTAHVWLIRRFQLVICMSWVSKKIDDHHLSGGAKFSAGIAITILAFFIIIPATICCVCAVQYAQMNVSSKANVSEPSRSLCFIDLWRDPSTPFQSVTPGKLTHEPSKMTALVYRKCENCSTTQASS
ncbi:unnamed protein product [Schistocephalus solidus]|uniref:Transmembrane protein n=1 Tax=Schistocephalus solidus TaxID=70667 RepID=A0A183TBF1_SCHSO|nr:unnamed protein product [Schistocephalus solidus]